MTDRRPYYDHPDLQAAEARARARDAELRADAPKGMIPYGRAEALNDIAEMLRCADAATVAETWAALTGSPIEVRDDGTLYIEDPTGEAE